MRCAEKLLVVFVLVALVLAGLSWWLGGQVEMTLDRQFEQLSQSPYFTSVSREYERGFFSARERLTLSLAPEWQERLLSLLSDMDLPAAVLREPVQIRTETRIRTGPLAGGVMPAAGTACSEVFVEGALGEVVSIALGGAPVVTGTARFRLGGGGSATLQGPAFNYIHSDSAAEGLTAFRWGGFAGKFDFSRDFSHISGYLRLPSVEIQTADGRLQISDLTITSYKYQPFQEAPLFYAGSMKLTLERVEVFGPQVIQQDQALLALSNMIWKADLFERNTYFDLESRLSIEELQVAGAAYGPAHYDLVLKRLHGSTLARLHETMIAEYYAARLPGEKGSEDASEEISTMELMVEMLRHSPELHRYEIVFNSAYGPASLLVRAGFEDLRPEDLDLPFIALIKLVASGELALPVELLRHAVVAWNPGSEALFDLQLNKLQKQGYVTLDDKRMTIRFVLRGLEVTVNGKPLNFFGSGLM